MKLTDEQQTLMDDLGYKNQRLWAAGFILIALLIVGINMICRYADSHKYDDYEYTKGTVINRVVSKIPRTGTRGNRYDYIYAIEVEYYAGDEDERYVFHNSDDDYEFMRIGNKVRVYYDEDDPDDCCVMKKDLLTGLYLPAETNYYTALYVAIFPVIIGIYLFADYQKAKKLALQNKLKPKKKVKSSKDPDYDPNLHELARMTGYKRSWLGFQIAGSLFYVLMMFGCVMTIRAVLKDPPDDMIAPIAVMCFFMLLAHGMLAGVIFSIVYVKRKKTAFIKAFMQDEATAVYGRREEASELLWKLVRKYMEKEPMWSRFKLEYNRDWLETYGEYLERLK